MKLGEKQTLEVIKEVNFGIYLAEPEHKDEKVLLPISQVPEGTKLGDRLEVFLYKDSKDRLISTVREPLLTLGKTAVLKVKEASGIGAFLDWGLEKDLLLPFKEQTVRVKSGDDCLVALYIDKSERLCATMKVYDYLQTDSPYQKEDTVTARIYQLSDNFGVFAAVDDRYSALIPQKDASGQFTPGTIIQARVTDVKADGKLSISTRQKAHLQIDDDARHILKVIDEFEGVLPFGEKVSSEIIKREFGLSKNAFKRAVGRLLKENKIKVTENRILKL